MTSFNVCGKKPIVKVASRFSFIDIVRFHFFFKKFGLAFLAQATGVVKRSCGIVFLVCVCMCVYLCKKEEKKKKIEKSERKKKEQKRKEEKKTQINNVCLFGGKMEEKCVCVWFEALLLISGLYSIICGYEFIENPKKYWVCVCVFI